MSKSVLMHSVSFIAAVLLLPSFAYAHVGVGEASGFMHGLTHPVSGLDHVCAMVAVGLWAAQMGGRSVWAVPLTFVSVMALGGALPMLGISLSFVEQGIVLSGLLLGVLIAASAAWSVCSRCGTAMRTAPRCRHWPPESNMRWGSCWQRCCCMSSGLRLVLECNDWRMSEPCI